MKTKDELKDKIINCKNSIQIFDTKDYVLYDDAIEFASIKAKEEVEDLLEWLEKEDLLTDDSDKIFEIYNRRTT